MADFRAALERWGRAAKRDAIAVWLAARDPRVPLAVKAFAALVAAYAMSPIDLIPDFIPVLGLLDELILLPAAVWVILRFIDPEIIAEHRAAATEIAARPVSVRGAAVVIAVWIAAAVLVTWIFWPGSRP
jgi:uncharacterized membrane protein YkvA (DUF1232 family)